MNAMSMPMSGMTNGPMPMMASMPMMSAMSPMAGGMGGMVPMMMPMMMGQASGMPMTGMPMAGGMPGMGMGAGMGMMMPMPCRMTWEMTKEGMVCKMMPMDPSHLEMMRDRCNAMTSMMAMGWPCMVACGGIPWMIGTSAPK